VLQIPPVRKFSYNCLANPEPLGSSSVKITWTKFLSNPFLEGSFEISAMSISAGLMSKGAPECVAAEKPLNKIQTGLQAISGNC
jgi:hypothetical protein